MEVEEEDRVVVEAEDRVVVVEVEAGASQEEETKVGETLEGAKEDSSSSVEVAEVSVEACRAGEEAKMGLVTGRVVEDNKARSARWIHQATFEAVVETGSPILQNHKISPPWPRQINHQ